MIFRDLSNNINNYISLDELNKNVLIINGVRQVGKTTAVRLALERSKKTYIEINLETNKILCAQIDKTASFNEFEQVLKRETNFVASQDTVLFIDEANESYLLGRYVRQMKEDWPHQTVILSGSMMNRLFRNPEIRIPVGRYTQMTVHPFSYAEFIRANEQIKNPHTKYGLQEIINNPNNLIGLSANDHTTLLILLDQYLLCGGLPQICTNYLTTAGNSNLTQDFSAYLESIKEDFLKFFSEEYANLFYRAIN